ncbi:MAG: hypothetical protein QOJ94_2757 [Sphingomonadales bacterium]|jgi:hypothetical protein|nr:hypothetical protein [Sphingomonadales bacterium]
MATNPFELYLVIAPIAAAFAGFGSLASGLGQRRGGDHARVDAMRLGSMLTASLSATLLALLPATLAGLFLDDRLAVRTSALISVVAIVGFALVSVARARKIRGLSGFSIGGAVANTACTLLALSAFALSLLDIPAGRVEALYLLGLIGLLGSSVVMFSRVIASMLRPHNEGQKPS